MTSPPSDECPGNWAKTWHLRLYVAATSPASQRALLNLRSICDSYLLSSYTLSVIDLVEFPDLAETDDIIAVPTLIRVLPLPVRRIIGDLSDTRRALSVLGVDDMALPSASGDSLK